MAKPRVFISSTYYDLKSIRTELERFVRDSGYDPVLNERGHIAYSKDSAPEMSCYREIASCDILVSVVGGRYGSSSHDNIHSISQLELKTAIEQNKQVYVFVQSDVFSEYRTWSANKSAKVTWTAVNNVKIYEFIESIFELPANNAVMPFETGHDVIILLKEQWAGLFQRLLQDSVAQTALEAARELRQGVETVRQLVDILSSKGDNVEVAQGDIKQVLLPNHPAFSRLKSLLRVPYRVFFLNKQELSTWLKARSFKEVDQDVWDDEDHMEWLLEKDSENWDLIKVSTKLFDDSGRFVPDSVSWSKDLIRREIRPREYDGSNPFD